MKRLLLSTALSLSLAPALAQEGGSFIPGGITSGSTTTSGFSAGQLPYSNGSTLQALSQGSSGQFLQSNGPGNAPTWANASGTGSGTVTSCSQYSVGVYLLTGTTINCSPNLQLNGATLEMGANGTPGGVTLWGNVSGQSTTLNASTYGGANSFALPYAPGGVLAIDPTTTPGDTVYRGAGGYFARLGVGSNGNCYLIASGFPSWGACPVNVVAGTSTASGFSNSAAQLFAVTTGGVIQPVTLGTNLTLSGSGPFTLNATGGGGGTIAWNSHVGGILSYNSATSLNVTAGQFADSTSAVYIAPTALTGGGLNLASNGCAGLDVGSSLITSAFYNVFAISTSSNASPCYIASIDWGPATTASSGGAFSTSSATVTLSANCPSWVVAGMTVYDKTSAVANAVIGTVSSCPSSGATLTLNANAAFAGNNSDSIRFVANPATGPTMPSGYSGGYFRIASAFETNSSSQVVNFAQIGDTVELATVTTESSSTPGVTSGQFLISAVPQGYRVRPMFNFGGGFSGGQNLTASSGDNANPAGASSGNFQNSPGQDYFSSAEEAVHSSDHYTDAVGRIRMALGNTSTPLYMYSRGWTFDWRQY